MRRFDWQAAPPCRFHALRRGPRTFRFCISFHHALLDGWSTATLLSELLARYAAATGLNRDPAPVPGESLFRDYVYLEGEARRSAAARAYWQTVLDGAPETRWARALPAPEQDAGGAGVRRHERAISDRTYRGLTDLAKDLGVPLKAVLLAAHVTVIGALLTDRSGDQARQQQPCRRDRR